MIRIAAAALVLALPATLAGQEPGGAAGDSALARSYRTIFVEQQLTVESIFQGGRTTVELGRLWPRGVQGHWLPQAALALTLLPGNQFLDGLALGPRVRMERALPLSVLQTDTTGALLLGVSGLADAAWRFAGIDVEQGWRLEPALRALVGYRLANEGGSFTAFELAAEWRAFSPGAVLYLRIGGQSPR